MRGLFVAGWQNTSTFCIRRSIFDVSFLKELKATPNTERRMSNFEVVVPLSDFRRLCYFFPPQQISYLTPHGHS